MPAAVADLGEPSGHPARLERRHSGLPLVRKGDRPPHGLQPPRRRSRDRVALLEGRQPVGRRRLQCGQPLFGRSRRERPHDVAHDPSGRCPRPSTQLVLLLRQPVCLCPGPVPDLWRSGQGGLAGPSPAPRRRRSAHRARRQLSVATGRDERLPASRDHRPHGRTHPARDIDHLRRFRRLRRDRAPRRA